MQLVTAMMREMGSRYRFRHPLILLSQVLMTKNLIAAEAIDGHGNSMTARAIPRRTTRAMMMDDMVILADLNGPLSAIFQTIDAGQWTIVETHVSETLGTTATATQNQIGPLHLEVVVGRVSRRHSQPVVGQSLRKYDTR